MERDRHKWNGRAWFALSTLSPEEQGRVREAVAAILDRPEDQWAGLGAIRLGSEEALYLLRVDESLRVILQASPGPPEVLDVVRRETLEHFRTLSKA